MRAWFYIVVTNAHLYNKQQTKIDDYTALLDILNTGGKLQFATIKDPFPTMRDQFTTIHINFFKKITYKNTKANT